MQTISRSQPHSRTASAPGLTGAEVAASRREHGANILSPQKKRSFARRFLSNLGDPVIKILLCALAVNLIFMFRRADWFETAGIAVSVFLATFISTVSEYGSEAAFSRLSEHIPFLSRLKKDSELSAFWAQVERVLPDYRKSREWLKEHEKELIGRL